MPLKASQSDARKTLTNTTVLKKSIMPNQKILNGTKVAKNAWKIKNIAR
jgi:hypothetical protein